MTLKLGMVGGGQGAFIGAVHRIAARLDGRWALVAGALSSDLARATASAADLGIAPDRSYSDFEQMAQSEAARPDGIDAVAIVTPNHLHAKVATAFLRAGIAVICDKPMTATLPEAEALAALVRQTSVPFVLTQTYTGYPMVREARRMVGDFVVTQKDLQTDLTKPDVIGMGSYNSDSHNVQRYVQPDGMAQNEGNMEVGVKPYQIPYRVLLPKRTQSVNLLVPVCFSASHVAYSTLRMEPQYMIIGQAAGIAAKMAIQDRKAVQEIDAAALSARLRELGAVFTWNPPTR